MVLKKSVRNVNQDFILIEMVNALSYLKIVLKPLILEFAKNAMSDSILE